MVEMLLIETMRAVILRADFLPDPFRWQMAECEIPRDALNYQIATSTDSPCFGCSSALEPVSEVPRHDAIRKSVSETSDLDALPAQYHENIGLYCR